MCITGGVISVNPVAFYQNIKKHINGKTEVIEMIKLRESENNFYNYRIVYCDSMKLELMHIESGLEMRMERE